MAVVHYPPNSREIKSIKKSSELDWSENISRCLQARSITEARDCQAVSWPALSENNSTAVILVAGSEQGKTSGWLLPILNKLTSADLYRSLPAGVGPRVCVFCNGQLDSLQIEEMMNDVITSAKLDLKVVVATRGSKIDSEKLNIELINGCDILIINPTAFAEHNREIMMNLQRCCHLVVESANQTLKNHHAEVASFFDKWREQRERLSLSDLPDQIVLVAQEWSESLSKFRLTLIKFKFDPLLIFASMVEAAIFRDIKFCPSFHEKTASRLDHLCHILQDNQGGQKRQHKIVICCSEELRVKILRKLQQVGISSHCLEGDSFSVKESLKSWQQSNVCNLVISDEFLVSLPNDPISFRGKMSVVHVGLETCPKTQFEMRFKLMRFQLQEKAGGTGSVHILLGPEDKKTFGSINSLLTRCSNQVQPDIFKKIRRASQELCSNNIGGRMCGNLGCKSSHLADVQLDLTDRGEVVKFTVIEVLSPVTFQVLLQSPQLDTSRAKVDLYFSKTANRKVLSWSEISAGMEVGVEDDGWVKRGRVLGTSQEEEVEVALYDTGEQKRVQAGCLMFLPASLQSASLPAGSFRLTVTGLAPLYRDPHWSPACRDVVTNHLLPLHHLLGRGRVLCKTSEVVWLERCQFVKYSPSLHTWITHLELQTDLVRLGWARTEQEFRNHLVQLMDEVGVEKSKPEKEDRVKEYQQKVEESLRECKPKKEVVVKEYTSKKEGEVEKSNAEKDYGGDREEDVDSNEKQNPSTSSVRDPYSIEELFEDLSFFDSCFMMETEKKDSNPVGPSVQDVSLKPKLVQRVTNLSLEAREKRFLNVIWDQDVSSVSLNVQCNSLLEVKEEDVSVELTEETLAVKVTEGNIVHVLPHSPLTLWSFTQPNTLAKTIKSGKIFIKFDKKTPTEWQSLAKEKFRGWITFNFSSSNLDKEEFNNNISEDNPEPKKSKFKDLVPESATDENGNETDTDTDIEIEPEDLNSITDDENEENQVDSDTESTD